MTEYELNSKLQDALQALTAYGAEKKVLNKSSIWADDIKKSLEDIGTKTRVLGAAGPICIRCHGSGVEP